MPRLYKDSLPIVLHSVDETVERLTLGEFLAINPDLDVEAIERDLFDLGVYRDGGGAQPEWSIEVDNASS